MENETVISNPLKEKKVIRSENFNIEYIFSEIKLFLEFFIYERNFKF